MQRAGAEGGSALQQPRPSSPRTAIGVARRIHFVSELLAAEAFFAILLFALLVTVISLYLIGAAGESLERHFTALVDFRRQPL